MDTMKDTTMQLATDAVIEELRKMQPTAWVYEDMLGRKCVRFERPLPRSNTHEPLFSAATHAVVMGLVTRLEAAEKERDWHAERCEDAMNECDALRAEIEAMEKQEPVAWQTRTRPAWNDGTWGPWRKCSEEYAEDIKKTPLLHDWLYEARALYALPGAQPVPNFADAYQGAMEEVAIWKKRALEAEDLNRKFVAEINGPTYMGEPAQPAPGVPDGWKLVPIEPTQEMINHVIHERLGAFVAGKDHTFIDIYKAMLAAAPEAKP